MSEIAVLIVEPGLEPRVTEIGNDLRSMQAVVGGYIEAVPLGGDAVLICNEEGKLDGLPFNRRFGNDILVGTFFIASSDDLGEFVSLPNSDIEKYTKMFRLPV